MSSSDGEKAKKEDKFDEDFITATNDAKPEEKTENQTELPDIKSILTNTENKEGKNQENPENNEGDQNDNSSADEKGENDNSEENKISKENPQKIDRSEDLSNGHNSDQDQTPRSQNKKENQENQRITVKSRTSTPSSKETRRNSPNKTRRSTQKKKQEEKQIPEETINQATQEIIDGADPNQGYDPQVLRAVSRKLNQMKNEAHAEKRYLDAEEYIKLMKTTSKAADVAEFSQHCVSTLNDLKEKETDAQQQLEELNEKWENEFRQFEEVIEEKKQALIEQHTKELEEFDNSIPSELPPKYLKHSPEYIQMRKTENSLAKNQRFAEAEAMKKKADRLEEIEIQRQMERLREDVLFQRDSLIQRQNRQVDLFAQWVAERRHQLLIARDRDMEGRAIRLDHYKGLVYNIEKKGLPPNRTTGFSTNRVSRKESIRAVRTASTAPRTPTTRKREELPLQYRPQSAISRKNSMRTASRSQKRSALITPTTNKR